MSANSPQTEDLKELHKNIWQTLLAKAFEVEFKEGIDLNRAREVQSALASRMQSAPFLEKVDEMAAGFTGDSKPKEQQHTELLGLILEGQMDVIPEFGYEGEEGYVQLQAQLMEHAVRSEASLRQFWVFLGLICSENFGHRTIRSS